MLRTLTAAMIFCLAGTALAAPPAPAQAAALANAPAHALKARAMAQKAIAFLRTQQDDKTGGWSVPKEGPAYPAITGLVITGMLLDPALTTDDPSIKRGIDFILSFKQPDGGIYDRLLPSYNTAICLSALALAAKDGEKPRADARDAILPAQNFLRSLQWSEDAPEDETAPERPKRVGKEHPFYGGVGYGRSGRPDNSNLGMVIQGMHDSGLKTDDVFFQRALVFLRRTQMQGDINEMAYAANSKQGGFIYSTSVNKDQIGVGQVMIPAPNDTIDEATADGGRVSRLRAYGSMTYMGFKSLLYANLDRADPRVTAAHGWIRRNYTLAENPGIGADGLYYFYLTFARAMDAWGEPTITPILDDQSEGAPRQWAADLVGTLEPLQEADGSFRPRAERWMENNKVLITAYTLIALQHIADAR